MDHLLQLQMLIPLIVAMVIGVILLALVCWVELRRKSRHALIVLL